MGTNSAPRQARGALAYRDAQPLQFPFPMGSVWELSSPMYVRACLCQQLAHIGTSMYTNNATQMLSLAALLCAESALFGIVVPLVGGYLLLVSS